MSVEPHTSVDISTQEGFSAEVKRATRGSAVVLAAVGLIAFPLWAVVDHYLAPEHAALFLQMRVAGTVAMLIAFAVLLRTSLGARYPEAIMVAFLAVPEVLISFMIARLHDELAIYGAGLSLAIYASAFLLIWSWRYTAALVGVTAAALGVAIASSSAAPEHELLGVAFYLGTASILAIAGQWYRHSLAWREFRNRDALEREQRRNQELVEQLERLAREDDLTGLANRRSFDQALDREIARARRNRAPLALLLCDLDRFKEVNDQRGHLAGDQVLKAMAALLSSRARRGDVVARLGGDEFAILCPDTALWDAHGLAEQVVRLTAEAGLPDGLADTTLSIGVALLEPSDTLPDHLYQRADEQLYRAKRYRNLAASAVG